jgi:NADH:ubiquinone oxidoreductase subunit F (NADH-binding)
MNRVLPSVPFDSLVAYVERGGGLGLTAARAAADDAVIEELVASGLRGRGGAGFPTGVKWRTVKSFASSVLTTSIVVNGAEGEPGTFKDRAIMRANPYGVIEGALIAAHVLGARSVVIAVKQSFELETAGMRAAIAEIESAGWSPDVAISVVEGPADYLFGEETALLEVIDGRPPLPRIAPPFRHGVVEVVGSEAEADTVSASPANVRMAENGGESVAPPVLVNNVETMVNVAMIVAFGAPWFRTLGTLESPGSIVCTVTGAVAHPGVVEVPMGTTVREVLDLVGGVAADQGLLGVLVGVSSAMVTPDQLDTALCHEAMAAIGSGLGSAGLIAVGNDVHPVSLAAGVSSFLASESCGQCTHCKEDGQELAAVLGRMVDGRGAENDLYAVSALIDTVAEGARCGLAAQQQVVVGSLATAFVQRFADRCGPNLAPLDAHPITSLSGVGEHGVVMATPAPPPSSP